MLFDSVTGCSSVSPQEQSLLVRQTKVLGLRRHKDDNVHMKIVKRMEYTGSRSGITGTHGIEKRAGKRPQRQYLTYFKTKRMSLGDKSTVSVLPRDS